MQTLIKLLTLSLRSSRLPRALRAMRPMTFLMVCVAVGHFDFVTLPFHVLIVVFYFFIFVTLARL